MNFLPESPVVSQGAAEFGGLAPRLRLSALVLHLYRWNSQQGGKAIRLHLRSIYAMVQWPCWRLRLSTHRLKLAPVGYDANAEPIKRQKAVWRCPREKPAAANV